MEARFKVQTHTSLEDMVALQRVSQQKWSRVVLWIAAIVCTISSILLWVWNGEDKLLATIVALFCWTMVLFMDRFSGWLAYRGRNRAVKEISYTFCDETVLIQDALEDGKLGYAAFVRLMEDRKRYFLFVQKRAAHILPKMDFTQGNPADFAAFIAEKTGIKVKQV